MLHALALALQGGAGVYETIFFQLHEKFQYPLTSLLWLDALGTILRPTPESLNRLNAILFACNAAACVALFRLSFVRPAIAGKNGVDWKVAVIAFAAAYVFWPTLYALYIGQIQVWIDLLFTLALTAWILERPLASGLLIGLACTIKPQLGLFLLWGIAWREWHFAIGVGGESFHANQSVNGLMNRLLFLGNNLDWVGDSFVGYSPLVYVTTALFSAVFVALPLGMAIAGRRRAAGPIDLALGGLCFTMASPIAWEHHYGVTLAIYIVAFGLLCRTASTKRRQVLLCLLCLSWLLVGSNLQALDVFSQTGWNVLQSPVLFGALLLVAILMAMIGLEQRPVTDARGGGLHKSP